MTGTRIRFEAGQAVQGAALARIAEHVGDVLDADVTGALRGRSRPLFVGIGASFAALALPVQLLRDRGVVSQRLLADELRGDARGVDADVVVAVSQGGRSTETLAALADLTVPRVALVNVNPSPLTELAEMTVDLGNEPDSYASTVGFTGTVVALERIAAAVAGVREDPWGGIELRVAAVQERARPVLAALAPRAATAVATDVVAQGASRASAEGAALLLREVARMPASASATRNYLHGEMESAGGTLHVVLGDDREVALARSLAGAGHTTLLLTTADVPAEGDLHVLQLPHVPAAVRVVLEVVVMQMLAATLAVERGLEIESFVFANDDTKQGGVDAADFLIAPRPL